MWVGKLIMLLLLRLYEGFKGILKMLAKAVSRH